MNHTGRTRVWMDRTKNISPSFVEKGDIIDGLYIEGEQHWKVVDVKNKVATLQTLGTPKFTTKAHCAAIQMNCRSMYKKTITKKDTNES